MTDMSVQTAFTEVADRVLVARYAQWDVNVGLVLGRDAALVVDTRASERQGRQVLDEVARLLGGVPLAHVVNTHVHFDHTFGNVVFTECEVHAHARVAATLEDEARRVKDACRADPGDAPEYGYTAADLRDVVATQLRLPDRTFTGEAAIDLGDRVVRLAYAGRAHTDGDIRVEVPDADVVFLGDLIEESSHPSLGADSWPLEWTRTLDAHLARVGPGTVVVPGHGRPVDSAFVAAQSAALATVAEIIRERHRAGQPLDAAQQEPDSRLPYLLADLREAFARGYAQLSGP